MPSCEMDMNRIRTRRQWIASIAVIVVLLLNAQGAHGQSASFAIFTGRAQDPQGASVAGATVIATDQETATDRTTQTTLDGVYRFDDLPPGIYDVVLAARSFARVEVKNVDLWVGEQRDINFNLVPAGDKQSLVVTAELP